MPAPVYLTRALLAERNVAVSDTIAWSNAKLNRAMLRVCTWLDTFTTGHFNPLSEQYAVNGDGRAFVLREDMLPIVKLRGINVVPSKTDVSGLTLGERYYQYAQGAWSPDNWHLFPQRLPRMVEIPGRFPRGRGNVLLDGVFGWLAPDGRKNVEVVTSTQITPSSTSATLVGDIAELEVGDVMQFDGRFNRIIEDVNYSTKVVTFDALEGLTKRTLAVGVSAACYGAPPSDVFECCLWFFQRALEMDATRLDGAQMDPSVIAGETVDNYKWQRLSPATLVGFGRSAGLIGVPEIDQRLQDLMPPAASAVIPGRSLTPWHA